MAKSGDTLVSCLLPSGVTIETTQRACTQGGGTVVGKPSGGGSSRTGLFVMLSDSKPNPRKLFNCRLPDGTIAKLTLAQCKKKKAVALSEA